MCAERSEAEEVLTVLTESGARCSDNLSVIQKIVKKVPGIHAVRAFKPYVWRVFAAEESDAFFRQNIKMCIRDRFCAVCVEQIIRL